MAQQGFALYLNVDPYCIWRGLITANPLLSLGRTTERNAIPRSRYASFVGELP